MYDNTYRFFFFFYIYWRFPCINILIELHFINLFFILSYVFILFLIRNFIYLKILNIIFFKLINKKLIYFLFFHRILRKYWSIRFNRLRYSYRNELACIFLIVLIILFTISIILNLEILHVWYLIFLIDCVNRFTQISK